MKVDGLGIKLIRAGELSLSEAKAKYNISSTFFYNIRKNKSCKKSFNKVFKEIMDDKPFTRIECDDSITYLFKRKVLIEKGFIILNSSQSTFNINTNKYTELRSLKHQLKRLYYN